jgi:hypothetical protein
MLSFVKRSAARVLVSLIIAVSLMTLTAPSAAAFDVSDEGNNKSHEARSNDKGEPAAAPATPPSINISYALYSDAIKLETAAATPAGAPTGPTPAPAVSTAPMTAGEKFNFWLSKTVLSPGAYGQSFFTSMINELLDNDEGKEDTVENFFADTLTRTARSMAFKITSGFFEKFAYATIFKQDPRYHRSDKKSPGGKIAYAVSRVFVTQGDRCGCDQFNISYLAGGLTASFIADQWEREERQGTSHVFRRWATHIGFTALSNILKEFIGGQ